jgi:hypothetical protein
MINGDEHMNAIKQLIKQPLWLVFNTVAALLLGYSSSVLSDEISVTLSGDQEVPPVATSASGKGTFTIDKDKSIKGDVTTSGVAGAAAHIHMGAPGKNGPVIVTLTKIADNAWSVPAGAKLTDAQYKSYKAGNLYVNVHSAAHKDGEIRGRLKPK